MDKIATALPDVEAIHAVDPNIENVGYVAANGAKRILAECGETGQDKGRRKIVEILDDDEVTFLRGCLRETRESHSDQIKSLKDKYDSILRLQKNKSDADCDALKNEIQTLVIKQREELQELDRQHDGHFGRLQEIHNSKRAAIRTRHVRSITEVQTILGIAVTSFRQQVADTIETESLEQLRERLRDAEAEANSYRLATDGRIRALQTSVAFMEGRAAKINSDLERTWQELNKHYEQDFVVTDIPPLHQYLDHRFQMMPNVAHPTDAESVDSWLSAQE